MFVVLFVLLLITHLVLAPEGPRASVGEDRAAGQTSALLNDGASTLKDARRRRVSPGTGRGRAVAAKGKLISVTVFKARRTSQK